MKRTWGAIALAAAMLVSIVGGPAMAAPPTVVPSPGYDARLQEQRAALQRADQARHVDSPAHRRTHKHWRGVTR